MSYLLLFVALVLLACSILKKLSNRLGIPSLLLFILLGMLLGSDGLFKITFEDYAFSEQISNFALILIMFYGGFTTKWQVAKPVARFAVLLSSVGTILTATLTGIFCHLVLSMPLLEGLLCGAILASTDAASVFSILRFKRLALKENTDALLEVESGSNDPFAYMLTVVILMLMEGSVSPQSVFSILLMQVFFGLLCGFAIGYITKKFLKSYHFDASGIETIFILALALFAYAACDLLGGNGFLSVYIVGIILGNCHLIDQTTLVPFFDGITSNMQAILFFLLGLLSFPSRMIGVLPLAIAIALFLTIIARPLVVFVISIFFKGSFSRVLLISFSGLRGAASIVFAIQTVLSPVILENDLFHIVFIVVLLSIAIQGSLLPFVAKQLDMIDEKRDILKTFTDYVDERPVNYVSFTVHAQHPWCNMPVSDLILPPHSLMVQLKRADQVIVPTGDTILQADDMLVMCTLEDERFNDFDLVEKTIEKDDLVLGHRLKMISENLNERALVILIQRGDNYFIPDGNTMLEEGDVLLINHHQSNK